jgi:5-methylcytosine-specific restriction endonuclease McrA
MYIDYKKQNNQEIDIEIKEIYNQMSKNEQWIVDNKIDDILNFEDWQNELYLLNCPIGHEWEYRYHYSEGGVLQLFSQCTTCGKKGQNSTLKHSTIDNFKEKVITGKINIFNVDLNNKYKSTWEEYRALSNIKTLKYTKIHNDKQTNSKQEWFKEHNEYLQTDQWKAIRLKVLKRDNFLCQGCLEAPATEVHHLSYAHWKNELMFELLSVCSNCHHNRIHIK